MLQLLRETNLFWVELCEVRDLGSSVRDSEIYHQRFRGSELSRGTSIDICESTALSLA